MAAKYHKFIFETEYKFRISNTYYWSCNLTYTISNNITVIYRLTWRHWSQYWPQITLLLFQHQDQCASSANIIRILENKLTYKYKIAALSSMCLLKNGKNTESIIASTSHQTKQCRGTYSELILVLNITW